MVDWETAWTMWKAILAILGSIVAIGILTIWFGDFLLPFILVTIAVITVFLYGKVTQDE